LLLDSVELNLFFALLASCVLLSRVPTIAWWGGVGICLSLTRKYGYGPPNWSRPCTFNRRHSRIERRTFALHSPYLVPIVVITRFLRPLFQPYFANLTHLLHAFYKVIASFTALYHTALIRPTHVDGFKLRSTRPYLLVNPN
jgi:hypothetical protein